MMCIGFQNPTIQEQFKAIRKSVKALGYLEHEFIMKFKQRVIRDMLIHHGKSSLSLLNKLYGSSLSSGSGTDFVRQVFTKNPRLEKCILSYHGDFINLVPCQTEELVDIAITQECRCIKLVRQDLLTNVLYKKMIDRNPFTIFIIPSPPDWLVYLAKRKSSGVRAFLKEGTLFNDDQLMPEGKFRF